MLVADQTNLLNAISKQIVDRAIEVHRTLGGPGLLEKAYQEALAWELRQRNFQVEYEKSIPVMYKGQRLKKSYRLDIVVNQRVIVECKAVFPYHPIFSAQMLTYLRMTGLELGLVINFGEQLVKDGIHRVANSPPWVKRGDAEAQRLRVEPTNAKTPAEET